jgi:hypothetical protein
MIFAAYPAEAFKTPVRICLGAGHKRGFVLLNKNKKNTGNTSSHLPVETSSPSTPTEDKERRIGLGRRRFSHSLHVPDKRSGIDRRSLLNAETKVKS